MATKRKYAIISKSPKEMKLPEFNKIISAKCRRINGEIETHLIRRIPTKDTFKGWQWSNSKILSYFTLDVIEWKYL